MTHKTVIAITAFAAICGIAITALATMGEKSH